MKNRIPPPIIAIAFMALAYLSGFLIPHIGFPGQKIIALISATLGFSIALTAALQFKRAMTTIDPLKPETASQLVTSGIFNHTRNPMYVGLVMILIGFSIYFGALAGFAIVPLFIICMNHMQIMPEEAAMQKLFGDTYTDYCKRVRRWI